MDEPRKAETLRDWLAAFVPPSPLEERERRVSDWLDGLSPFQSTAGDASHCDELHDLIALLEDTDKPFRLGLAHSFAPVGLSFLVICKRLRRPRGRPPRRSAEMANAIERPEICAVPELDDCERKAFGYLLDQNRIRRVIRNTRWGEKITIEEDLSGGLIALISLLQATDRPLHAVLRKALAYALSSSGRLIVRKRPQPRRGRPRKRSAEKSYAIHSAEARLERAKRILERQRPRHIAGTEPKPISKRQAIGLTKFGRTTTYKHIMELARFRRKHKKNKKN